MIPAEAIYRLQDHCPECGDEPGDDTLHREGCPRIDTCGMFGPPWLAGPWHPFTEVCPDYTDTRQRGEPLGLFSQRYEREFTQPLHEHWREAHDGWRGW